MLQNCRRQSIPNIILRVSCLGQVAVSSGLACLVKTLLVAGPLVECRPPLHPQPPPPLGGGQLPAAPEGSSSATSGHHNSGKKVLTSEDQIVITLPAKVRRDGNRTGTCRGSSLPVQKCEWCGGLEFAYFKFLRHVRLLHPQQEAAATAQLRTASPMRCRVCGEGALSRADLARHVAHSHPKGGDLSKKVPDTTLAGQAAEIFPVAAAGFPSVKLSCEKCNISFVNRDRLADHVNQHHNQRPPGEAAYRCAHCGKRSSATRAFKNHLNLHLEKESLCIKCGETFGSLYELKKHNRIHVREQMHESRRPRSVTKAFLSLVEPNDSQLSESISAAELAESSGQVCHICARRFKSANSLNSHLRNVHLPEADQLTCARCGKRFKTKRALGVHALLHEAPRLACPHCPKMLHTGLYLKGE